MHRDFKPHNVLVGKDDHVYVSDFGLATSFETAKMGMTRSGAFVGTPKYMSPEQVEGGTVDTRSDLYSLGLVIYEMATGEVPFAGESTWQVMYRRVKEKPKDPKLVNPDLPDWVCSVILRCLEKDVANRYQTAQEILTDIDAHRSTSSHSHSVVLPITEKAAKWTGTGIGVFVVLVILFFAIPTTRHWVFRGGATTGGVGRRGFGVGRSGGCPVLIDDRKLGADGDGLVLGHGNAAQDAGNRRRDLGIHLVGRDLEKWLVRLNVLTLPLEPTSDCALSDALTELWHRYGDRHC